MPTDLQMLFLYYSQKHNPTSFDVIMNIHSIFPNDNLKYLVLLDTYLSWKPHVAYKKVKTQLSRACGVLYKRKNYKTQSVLKVVYNALIHHYITQSAIGDVLQTVAHRCAGIIYYHSPHMGFALDDYNLSSPRWHGWFNDALDKAFRDFFFH